MQKLAIKKTGTRTRTVRRMRTITESNQEGIYSYICDPSSYLTPNKILLVCHSFNDDIDKIYQELNISRNVNIERGLTDELLFDTNNPHGTHKDDIKIDLSTEFKPDKVLRDNFKLYDIIYLENCPVTVYINNERLNIYLFKNLVKLLESNGVIITRLADYAIDDILKTEKPRFDRDFVTYIPGAIKKQGILKTASLVKHAYNKTLSVSEHLLLQIRKIIKQQLIDYELDLELVDIATNCDYINSRTPNIYDYDYNKNFYFIFKKKSTNIVTIVGGNKNRYKIFKTKDNKIIKKKIFIIDNKEKILFGKKKNGEPKYVSFKTFSKSIN